MEFACSTILVFIFFDELSKLLLLLFLFCFCSFRFYFLFFLANYSLKFVCSQSLHSWLETLPLDAIQHSTFLY